jgi:hypothetical protein
MVFDDTNLNTVLTIKKYIILVSYGISLQCAVGSLQ